MKKFIPSLFLSLILLSAICSQTISANWYAGAKKYYANGVRANISAPISMNLVGSGQSNWVSTVEHHPVTGRNWIQAGWKIYDWYPWNPVQYVEICKDCEAPYGGFYYMKDDFGSHLRGNTVFYEVRFEGNNGKWCGYTEGYERTCLWGLHYSPVDVLAKSEIHSSPFISLDTFFSDVQYLDANTNTWRNFYTVEWIEQYPYLVDAYSASNFHTYRDESYEAYIPLAIN